MSFGCLRLLCTSKAFFHFIFTSHWSHEKVAPLCTDAVCCNILSFIRHVYSQCSHEYFIRGESLSLVHPCLLVSQSVPLSRLSQRGAFASPPSWMGLLYQNQIKLKPQWSWSLDRFSRFCNLHTFLNFFGLAFVVADCSSTFTNWGSRGDIWCRYATLEATQLHFSLIGTKTKTLKTALHIRTLGLYVQSQRQNQSNGLNVKLVNFPLGKGR